MSRCALADMQCEQGCRKDLDETVQILARAADLAARNAELADMEAERNRCRSEAAAAGRAADRLTSQLAAMPKVCLVVSSGLTPGVLFLRK